MILTPPAASADVLRTMAHDIRQPLSTIESIAYYLSLVLPPGDQKVHEQLSRIQQLVEQSNWIVTSAQQLTEPLRVTREAVHLEELIARVILERSAVVESPALEIIGEVPPVQADPALLRALIGNLLMLLRLTAGEDHHQSMRLFREENVTFFEIATHAPGFKSEASMGPGGTLSLESARRLAAAHGGSVEASIDPESGIRVRVVLG